MLRFLAPVFIALLAAGMGVILATGLRRGNMPAVVNAAVCLALTLVPIALEFVHVRRLGDVAGLYPVLPAAIGLVCLFHAYGMLGPYDDIWWWDHLTHLIAAGILAALVSSTLPVLGLDGPLVGALIVIGITGLAGIFWELIELFARAVGRTVELEPVLVHYGWWDTALDLGFDLLGALLVVVFGLRPFRDAAAAYPAASELLFELLVGGIVVGTVVLAVANRHLHGDPEG